MILLPSYECPPLLSIPEVIDVAMSLPPMTDQPNFKRDDAEPDIRWVVSGISLQACASHHISTGIAVRRSYQNGQSVCLMEPSPDGKTITSYAVQFEDETLLDLSGGAIRNYVIAPETFDTYAKSVFWFYPAPGFKEIGNLHVRMHQVARPVGYGNMQIAVAISELCVSDYLWRQPFDLRSQHYKSTVLSIIDLETDQCLVRRDLDEPAMTDLALSIDMCSDDPIPHEDIALLMSL